ncbi:uncharacterized protein Dana_GF16478, isoform A [Drosophila ananassae]|uniref:Uncharacterized protein, isoform A n=1 Tax=Drosophila ananassae TaxID=7217 RepID=B3M379_DROAN|nr:uncharacterized protein LOC6499274 isoform X1 [Drosophila ananassae]EDV43540.1 uncharacterized protein Dana_GF16478, isoform A [Drosophila ananassae]
MGKKYKSKSVPLQKKERLTVIKEEPEKCEDNNESKPLSAASSDDSEKHLEQMAAIENIPLRLDEQIESIKSVQKELLQLQMRQVTLLDGCIDILQELNGAQPRNIVEQKLILETFSNIKPKILDIFKNLLPSQLELFKHETKMLEISEEITSK